MRQIVNSNNKIDERMIVNKVVFKMLTEGGENGKILIRFDDLNIDLSVEEICHTIQNMGYDVVYDQLRNLYIISKIRRIFNNSMQINKLFEELNNLSKNNYFKDNDLKLIDISNISLDLDDVAKIIKHFGFSYYFNDVTSVWIL